MSRTTTDAITYTDTAQKILSESDRTTQGDTLQEEYRELDISPLSSDGKSFANVVFAHESPRAIAEAIGLSIIYDDTQAGSRLAEVYSRTRKDYYSIASNSIDDRNSHTKFKRSVVVGMINSAKPVKEAISLE